MKIQLVSMFAAFLAVTMLVGIEQAQAAEGSLDAAINSAYVWRGQVINDEEVLQPSVDVASELGLSFNAWGNLDLTDRIGESGEFSEVDLTVNYSVPMEGAVSLDVGVIEYLFPKEGIAADPAAGTPASDLDTRELYASIGVEAPLSPSIGAYLDVDEAESGSAYIVASVGHGVEVSETVSVEAGASIAYATEDYNLYYYGVKDGALNDVNLSLSSSVALSESVSVGASITYTFLPDSDIEKAAKATYLDDEQVWGGINLSAAF